MPKEQQPGFPISVFHSLRLIFLGGGGLVLASALATFAGGISKFIGFRILSFVISFVLLVCVFYMAFKMVVDPQEREKKALITSAVAAAVGVSILQVVGNYILTHELKNLGSLYSNFALVLGLLFWINLQAQILILAAEAGSVRLKQVS